MLTIAISATLILPNASNAKVDTIKKQKDSAQPAPQSTQDVHNAIAKGYVPDVQAASTLTLKENAKIASVIVQPVFPNNYVWNARLDII